MTYIVDANDIPELCDIEYKCPCSEKYQAGEDDGVDEAFSTLSHEALSACLLNKSGREPLPVRFRALFALRNLADEESIQIISQCFNDSSALLKHELAYVLGQIKNPSAIPTLNNVLSDEGEDPMVRHEAAEALGAIGSVESLPILRNYAYTAQVHPAVRETCEIAIDSILKNHQADDSVKAQIKKDSEGGLSFSSVDPAPAGRVKLSVVALREQLLNADLSLYDRYKAMFALRNQGSEEAVLALCDGLEDESSALFRHEVAFVLGQLKHPASIPALTKSLAKVDEAPMVRHESAEAIGSIATEECEEILKGYLKDPVDVVRESCIVALDICEYENSEKLGYFEGKGEK